jgi:hypothetical protein
MIGADVRPDWAARQQAARLVGRVAVLRFVQLVMGYFNCCKRSVVSNFIQTPVG